MCATPAAVCGGLVNISSVFLFFSLDFTLISLSVSVLSDRGLPQGLLSGGGRILSLSHPDQLTHIFISLSYHSLPGVYTF